MNTLQSLFFLFIAGLPLTACGQGAENAARDISSEILEAQTDQCDQTSTFGNLDASADCVMAEMNKSMSGTQSAGSDDLDANVYISEGGGFTVESAKVITEQVTTYPTELRREPDVYRVTTYVEDYGDRIGIIEDRISFQQNGNRLD